VNKDFFFNEKKKEKENFERKLEKSNKGKFFLSLQKKIFLKEKFLKESTSNFSLLQKLKIPKSFIFTSISPFHFMKHFPSIPSPFLLFISPFPLPKLQNFTSSK